MGWLKHLLMTCIILSAAVCVSCQELASTLREGNRTCPGEEIIFNCTIRGSSTLPVLVLEWRSAEYIGQDGSLQLSTTDPLGEVEESMMDGIVTATATLINSTNIGGVLILESTLRIVASEASVVTCSGTNGVTESIEFSIPAIPEAPQTISAAEVSRVTENICIILVQWDPPANSDLSDISQYIVYVPSQNIREVAGRFTTLTVPSCGDDLRIQVAAVNRIGCVGMNSSAVQPVLLSIPTGPGSATTEGGSATTTSTTVDGSLSSGAILGITIGGGTVLAGVLMCATVVIAVLISYCILKQRSARQAKSAAIAEERILKLIAKELKYDFQKTLDSAPLMKFEDDVGVKKIPDPGRRIELQDVYKDVEPTHGTSKQQESQISYTAIDA